MDLLQILGSLGSGPIPRLAGAIYANGKQKDEQQALLDFIKANTMQEQPAVAEAPVSFGSVFAPTNSPAKQVALGLDDYLGSYQPTPEGRPDWGAIRQQQAQQPIQQPVKPAQPAQPAQQRGQDFILKSVIDLANKGVDINKALAFVGGFSNAQTAEENKRLATSETPKLRTALEQAVRTSDRASALGIIIQLQQYGVKVPQELVTWADPNKQHITNDLGDKVANGSYNPRDGKYSFSQVFQKGAKPMSEFENYRVANGLVGSRGGKGGSGGNDDPDASLDPAKVAKGIHEYRKFMNNLVQKEDGSYRSSQEIRQYLDNDNFKAELAAIAAASNIDPEQVRNDIDHIRRNL